MQNPNGKRVVITGGSQGLGLVDEHVMQRYMHGVAYGFRSDSDILPLDI